MGPRIQESRCGLGVRGAGGAPESPENSIELGVSYRRWDGGPRACGSSAHVHGQPCSRQFGVWGAGFSRVWGLGLHFPPILENQMGKKMEHEMETGEHDFSTTQVWCACHSVAAPLAQCGGRVRV